MFSNLILRIALFYCIVTYLEAYIKNGGTAFCAKPFPRSIYIVN